MSSRRCARVPALLAIAVAVAGCGGAGGDTFAGPEWGKPNATDAAFARGMVAHERAIGSIAQLGSKKALREELREIAKSTLAEHGQDMPALARFKTDLRSRGVSPAGALIRREPPPYDPRGLRHAVSFDHEFLVTMIAQHEYAVAAARVERDHGGNTRLRLLARAIYESRRRDLAKLKRWLRTWYGDDTLRGVPPLPQPAPSPPPPGGGPTPGPEV